MTERRGQWEISQPSTRDALDGAPAIDLRVRADSVDEAVELLADMIRTLGWTLPQ